ncbi:hypothetical protein TrCOL_g3452 [Triparma columacea]|uniref:protochlorophyllide reductase n=1 Tax=Triparma columacea TaxID=722753 RepID=A0A9W7FZY3_9STRA|nr:hypothetical protein TrCOL_g3452 [Triparma columacea]
MLLPFLLLLLLPSISTLSPSSLSRRVVLASPLTLLIDQSSTLPTTPINKPNNKSVLITGASSGIGYDATLRFIRDGYKVYVSTRSRDKTDLLLERIGKEFDDGLEGGQVVGGVMDLSSFGSIEEYVASLKSDPAVRDRGLDVVALNAGLARNIKDFKVSRTTEGFEGTVGVNHFGHFKLISQGVGAMIERGGGRVVVTASGVHDPDSPGGKQGSPATLGDLRGIEAMGRGCEMVDGGGYDPDKAYKDSKLCNVFFGREYQRRLEERGVKNVLVNSFTPGLIVGTGLFRDQNPVFTKLFDVAATDIFKVGESVSWGGGALHYMATNGGIGRGGLYYGAKPGASRGGDGAYGTTFNVDGVSREVREGEEKQRRLWELSEKLM